MSEFFGERVPDPQFFPCGVARCMLGRLALGVLVGGGIGYVVMGLVGVTCWVVVDVPGPEVVVVVLRSVAVRRQVDEGVHENACSVDVEVGDGQYLQCYREG